MVRKNKQKGETIQSLYVRQTHKPKEAKILSFDLEVSPALGYFYPPTYETGILETVERQKLMSFSYQWVGSDEVFSRALPDYKTFKRHPHDDAFIVAELHSVMSNADILLGQNSDRFDVKMANYFFVLHGLDPLPPIKTIDTLKIAKRHFRFVNNSLDNLGKELGHGGKNNSVGSLWRQCWLENSVEAYEEMKIYNENDVRVTTEVYLSLRPFMATHPQMGIITGDVNACPKCTSKNFVSNGFRSTQVMTYRRYQCNDCRTWFRERIQSEELKDLEKPEFSL